MYVRSDAVEEWRVVVCIGGAAWVYTVGGLVACVSGMYKLYMSLCVCTRVLVYVYSGCLHVCMYVCVYTLWHVCICICVCYICARLS